MKKTIIILLILLIIPNIICAKENKKEIRDETITINGNKVRIKTKLKTGKYEGKLYATTKTKYYINGKEISKEKIQEKLKESKIGTSKYLIESMGIRKALDSIGAKIRKNTYKGNSYFLRLCLAVAILIFVYEYTTGKEISMKTWVGAIMILFFLLLYTTIMPILSRSISKLAHFIYQEDSINTGILTQARQRIYSNLEESAIGVNVKGIITEISFMALELVTSIASYVIYIIQGLMYITGPIAFLIAIIPRFRKLAWNFMKNYIGVSFWGVTLAVFLQILNEYTIYLSRIMDSKGQIIEEAVAQELPRNLAKQLVANDFLTMKLVAVNLLLTFFIIATPKITKLYLSWPMAQANRMASSIIQKTTALMTLAQSKGVKSIIGGTKTVGKTANNIGKKASSGSVSKGSVENNIPVGGK